MSPKNPPRPINSQIPNQAKDSTNLSEQKLHKKGKIKKYVVAGITSVLLSSVIFVFGLFWQDDTSLMAIGDSLWLVFAVELMFAWTLFVYNQNIFSPLIHGTKTVFLMFLGRKPKEDYYTYFKKIEENQVPSFLIYVAFLSTLSVLIPAIIIMIIVMN